jgi:hypothetical protein
MSERERPRPSICPRCGGTVVSGARLGSACPACLMGLAIESAPADDESVDEENVYRVVTVLDQEPGRTVYLADSRDTGQLVTLDIVKPPERDPARVSAFLDRVRRLRALSHSSLAAVLEGRVTSTGDFCVVARFVAGTAFEGACRHAGAKPADVISGLIAICDAIEQAHRAGVPHGRLGDCRRIFSCGPLSRPVVTGFAMWQTEPPIADDDVGAVAAMARRLGWLDADADATSLEAIRAHLDARAR